MASKAAVLKQTKREMIRRHRQYLKKAARKPKEGESTSEEDTAASSEGSGSCESGVDAGAEELAAGVGCDDEGAEGAVGILRDPRPEAGADGAGGEADGDWARASAEERLSAAGAADPAADRVVGAGAGEAGREGKRPRGALFNPKDYP